MTVLTILFFRSRLKDFVKSSFLFENAFFAKTVLDLIFLAVPVLCHKAPKIIEMCQLA